MLDFDKVLEEIAALDEADVARPIDVRGRKLDVRNGLYWLLQDAQEALVQVAARPLPESRRILALAQRAFGDLRGMLAGLPADLLDRAPRDGEWSIREVLAHVIAIEQRYALQTAYAAERADSDPMRLPDNRLPPNTKTTIEGDIRQIIRQVAAARTESDKMLGDLPPAAMTRPAVWVQYEIDVRFRMHRIGAHVAEHAIQCDKTLTELGWKATEGRRIARLLAATVGEIEGLGGHAEARGIEHRIAEALPAFVAA
jgi:hypothetical protein